MVTAVSNPTLLRQLFSCLVLASRPAVDGDADRSHETTTGADSQATATDPHPAGPDRPAYVAGEGDPGCAPDEESNWLQLSAFIVYARNGKMRHGAVSHSTGQRISQLDAPFFQACS